MHGTVDCVPDMDTQVADSLLGSLVGGRYRLRDRLTRGGAAAVYAATDERLGRPVAVTITHPAPGSSDQSGAHFVHQAQQIARLTHPNVIATYDQGTHQGLSYLVREHVQGRSLREVLAARRRLSPEEALAIAEQVLAGLAAAHRAGLVHGEVQPAHVLVSEAPSAGIGNLLDAVAKIGEFGFAGPGRASADPAYVAPELVTGGYADPRSDVYSTGIMLFEMLTGRVPYDTGGPAEIAWQHVDRTVPAPSRYRPELPSGVDQLVTRATDRQPGARPSDAGALLAEVRAVRQQLVGSAPAPISTDSTMVISAVPATERPAWARLPSGGAGRPRAGSWTSTHTGGRGRAPFDPVAAARQQPVLVAVGAAVALLLVVGVYWFGFGRWMPAPDLTGMPQQEAVAEAEAQGLRVIYDDPRHSEHVAEGLVLAQEPTDRIKRGGSIMLTLSLGSEAAIVPDVIGADAEVARRQLERLGLEVIEGEPGFSNTVPQGRVLSVDPEAGTEMQPGGQVVLTVSRGRAPIEVPHLIGAHIDDARAQLHHLGLEVEEVEIESERPGGEVIHQDPGAGAGVEPGDTVRLEISDGPSTIPVPDVMGDRCGRAERTLAQAGFVPVLVAGDGGRVVAQNPSPGTGLPPGSEVHLLCSR
jgi:eukaryotic-like serine/threonine-protein kinase